MSKVKRVERHFIKANHKFYSECGRLALASKNLFNYAQYNCRQSFIYGYDLPSLSQLNTLLKDTPQYQALPAKVSQLVLKQVCDAWQSYFKSLQEYKISPSKFTGKPKNPGYALERNLVKFNYQALSKTEFQKNRLLKPSKTNIFIGVSANINFDDINEVRIVPKVGGYVIEVVYDVTEFINPRESGIVAAIDLGLDNLATVAFNQAGLQPIIINGKPLKAVNQFWNKRRSLLQSLLITGIVKSQQLDNLTCYRNNYVDNYLHQSTKKLVTEFVRLGVSKVAIGNNKGWKFQSNMGKKSNQKFVQIPHQRFIEILTYKCQNLGITVIVSEESYTSKASYLDWDNIPTYNPNCTEKHIFSGKRIARSWYKSADGILIHADVNGALNIGRKVFPMDFVRRDRGCLVVHPRRITPVSVPVRETIGVA
ncbi:transposase, IS605 OrfB family, central region [Nostoc sp. PCC 7524]|uniref:RNA-guided endonuclease InsQ/TnpB family protein n=1 Tax=Nostoc sp. (strain ATCC 29411 / PCC 7524) TaxID=28072 RepID=UPI00029F354D|nr:RNA-guided endonuclease TnpB family protein [Nostoc sp. PCC 7524]AFY46064.1 transposase, IS605 OrfB family, central region [Nostoc sp. PCC 7524]